MTLRPGNCFVFLILVLFASFSLLLAGGPILVSPTLGAFRWDPAQPVLFTVDQGKLGVLTSEQAANLVRDAAARWTNVESSTMTLVDNGFLSVDVVAGGGPSGFSQFLGECDGGLEQPAYCMQNPIIFDSDGEITAELFGEGNADTILGFAAPVPNPLTGEIVRGFAVLNGLKAMGGNMPKAFTHELGHMLGLDHSQGVKENEIDRVDFGQFLPLMFPVVYQQSPIEPILDDQVWLSWLYPENDFATTTGTIAGQVFRRGGGPMFNANVVAAKAENDQGGNLVHSREVFVANVSDFLFSGTGFFEIPGLPPGDYLVYIEPVESRFTGGSSVGPRDVRFEGFERDFFNSNESGDPAIDDPEEKQIVTVQAGQIVSNIDLITNEETNQLDSLTDDDSEVFVFPDGFVFPFFGQVYDQVVVNTDGNLTFGASASDNASSPRSVPRFLSGPPRIGPLFTDLNPELQGEIRAETGPDFVQFTWDGVPEFGGFAPNTFSVTLFANGNVEFDYQEVSVTADGLDGLVAVVGITPGGVIAEEERDLSAGDRVFSIGAQSIYQSFNTGSFDLEGVQVLFQAEDVQLWYPFYEGTATDFTGFAVTNFGESDTLLTVEGLDSDGTLLAFPNNPDFQEVSSQTQLARLGSEFFKVPATSNQSGWIRISSSRPELASFFQFGNGLDGSLTKMDGSVAFTEQSQILFFTRLYDGPASFPTLTGGKAAATRLHVANPNKEAISVTFRLFNSMGQQVGTDVVRALPSLGFMAERLSELFDVASPVSDGFVRVEVDGPGAVGFAIIELEDTVLGLNAIFPSSVGEAFSAQLGKGLDIFTSLKIVNPLESLVTVTIRAFIPRGGGNVDELVAGPIVLQPKQSFQRDVSELFTLEDGAVGSIRVDSSQAGVVGDVIFGDPQTGQFAAALPLQNEAFTEAYFSQVSNGNIDPNKPSLETFTGLAIFNPTDQTALVTIEVFDAEGTLVGDTSVEIVSNGRLSNVLAELVSESDGLIRGFIRVTSDRPVIAQQLLGNVVLQFLSAVPPTVVQ